MVSPYINNERTSLGNNFHGVEKEKLYLLDSCCNISWSHELSGPMGAMHPSSKFLLISGMILFGSISNIFPNPLQFSHAPIGELNEKF